MSRKRGRPLQQPDGRWRHSEMLARRVAVIMKERDSSNPETITEVGTKLLTLARRVLRPRALEPKQAKRLRLLARSGKPSEITRTLQSWRFNLTDRSVRVLQQQADLEVFYWG